jgi:hypothetical protein
MVGLRMDIAGADVSLGVGMGVGVGVGGEETDVA